MRVISSRIGCTILGSYGIATLSIQVSHAAKGAGAHQGVRCKV
jgi:hypothetical protein